MIYYVIKNPLLNKYLNRYKEYFIWDEEISVETKFFKSEKEAKNYIPNYNNVIVKIEATFKEI